MIRGFVVSVAVALCLGCAATARAQEVVWAVGDAGDGTVQAMGLASRIISDQPDRLLYLGDVYPDGRAEDFAERYDPLYGPLKAITWPTPGNHDWANRARGYYPYWSPRVRKPYYRVAIAGWEVLSLNSGARTDERSPQVKWLKKQLDRTRGTCRLAFWHEPRYSPGSVHGNEPRVAPLWNALRRRARIVINAHDHVMVRYKRRDGISQYISGAGGYTLYRTRPDPRVAFAATPTQGALRMTLSRGRASLQFRTATGAVLDRSSVRCKPLTPAPRRRR
jgi:acid phosphatase type 7